MEPMLKGQLLVHGFLRRISIVVINTESTLHSPSISDLFNLVATFHPIVDEWNLHRTTSKYIITDQRLSLQQLARVPYTFWNAFGTIRIGMGQTRKWKLKICSMDDRFWSQTCSVSIGIIPLRKLPFHSNEEVGVFSDETNGGYAYVLGNGWLKHYDSFKDGIKTYGTPCKVNDVIEMELRMESPQNMNGQLRFCVNGRDQGCAFSNVHSEEDGYVLAVSMWKGDAIELLE